MNLRLKSHSRLRLLFALVGTVLLSQPGIAQITPHSALKNFKLPKYNENSFRQYTLSGIEGLYDSKGFFTVKSAKLAIYSGDADQELKTSITSDLAVFDLSNDTASGASKIEIKDAEFDLQGVGWTLDMENQIITIESKGKIRFYDAIDLDLTGIF